MNGAVTFPMTRQGVRDLDRPRPSSGDTPVNVGEAERGASALLGVTLAGFGLAYPNLWGLLLATIGCGMVCRGMSGHCAIYAAAGINTAR